MCFYDRKENLILLLIILLLLEFFLLLFTTRTAIYVHNYRCAYNVLSCFLKLFSAEFIKLIESKMNTNLAEKVHKTLYTSALPYPVLSA